MFSFLKSPTKLLLNTSADASTLLSIFQARICDDCLNSRLKYFGRANYFIGKICGGNVEVGYMDGLRNFLRPKIFIQVTADSKNCSVVSTKYEISPYAKAFWIVWMSVAIVFCLAVLTMAFGPCELKTVLFAIGFPVFGALQAVIGRLMARQHEEKLESLVRDVVKTAEAAATSTRK